MTLTIEDRFAHGNLTVQETRALKNVSNAKFYTDLHAGLVAVRKIGTKSVVPGPIAKRYINGEPILDIVASTPGLVLRPALREALAEAE